MYSHCYFVSNCIAARNHKHFFIFLTFGTICAIFVSITNAIHVIYVYFIFPENIWQYIIMENVFLFIFGTLFTIIPLLLVIVGCMNVGCALTQICIGYSFIIFSFYKYKPKDIEYPLYINPFSMFSLIGSINLGVFVGSNFCIQLRHISNGITTKQAHSIRHEIYKRQEDNENQLDKEYTRNKTFNERMHNIIQFLKNPKPPSLIEPKRDL